jgi:hypothetical protein
MRIATAESSTLASVADEENAAPEAQTGCDF